MEIEEDRGITDSFLLNTWATKIVCLQLCLRDNCLPGDKGVSLVLPSLPYSGSTLSANKLKLNVFES